MKRFIFCLLSILPFFGYADAPVEYTVNGITFRMIPVAGGTFTMGATGELTSNADHNEMPTHQVTLSDYMIGQTEVTQQLWQAVMGENPSYFKCEDLPVERVSWKDCQEFINKLNELTGHCFRLPTEAEWEYAAKGGNKAHGFIYSGSDNIDEVGWYDDIAECETNPVATKAPNELGIYDMSGNVWEWCEDWKGEYTTQPQTDPKGPDSGSLHAYRGGGWFFSPMSCRVSARDFNSPDYRNFFLGMRLALAPESLEIKSAGVTAQTVLGKDEEKTGIATTPTEKSVTVNGVTFRMVPVTGGTFTMGATGKLAAEALSDEKTTHQVTLSDYMIGQTEVTQKLWQAVMGENPSYFKCEDLPVERVSWKDCQEFINKLNELTGHCFRLPTEAEWEYAAKGGNKAQGYLYSGLDDPYDVGWFNGNGGNKTHPVASKASNELGIYDMSGNVWEWCEDWKGDYTTQPQTNPKGPDSGVLRVIRGGSWGSSPGGCHVSTRYDNPPDLGNFGLGLRLVLIP